MKSLLAPLCLALAGAETAFDERHYDVISGAIASVLKTAWVSADSSAAVCPLRLEASFCPPPPPRFLCLHRLLPSLFV